MHEEKAQITFVFPGFITVPMGGVKVVNRLAERLSDRNYNVTLVYPKKLKTAPGIKAFVKQYWDKKNKVADQLYYHPGKKVEALVVNEISEKYIPNGDYMIAVGWQTAEAVNSLSAKKGKKFYFLQSFEAYFSNSKAVLSTYQLPLRKIALSQWIMKEMTRIGEKCCGPVGNSINPSEFYIESHATKDIDILMLYHPAKIKNFSFGLKVIKQIQKDNNYKITLFSARQPVHRIPDYIDVVVRPQIHELRHLYNRSKIFFSTSQWEGWGLTPMEAMACGCAVVAVKNKGVIEFLSDKKNCFLIKKNDKNQAENRILKFLKDENLRNTYTAAALKTLAKYTEDRITSNFEKCLTQEK